MVAFAKCIGCNLSATYEDFLFKSVNIWEIQLVKSWWLIYKPSYLIVLKVISNESFIKQQTGFFSILCLKYLYLKCGATYKGLWLPVKYCCPGKLSYNNKISILFVLGLI